MVEWLVSRDGDNCLVFSGGLPQDITGEQPAITMIHGKNTTVLEMDFCVLDFVTLTDTPWRSEQNDPQSIVVLLTNDLVAIDCKSTGLPCYENPYAMDLQESPVTCCAYISDCPAELILSLYSVSSLRGKKSGGWSTNEWPINGGQEGSQKKIIHHELLVTGHSDGSVRFWDTTNTSMQHLCRLRTQKLFEKNKAASQGLLDDDPYAITNITFGNDSMVLAVSGCTGQVILYTFNKMENHSEIACLEIPIIYEVSLDKTENSTNLDSMHRPPLR